MLASQLNPSHFCTADSPVRWLAFCPLIQQKRYPIRLFSAINLNKSSTGISDLDILVYKNLSAQSLALYSHCGFQQGLDPRCLRLGTLTPPFLSTVREEGSRLFSCPASSSSTLEHVYNLFNCSLSPPTVHFVLLKVRFVCIAPLCPFC